MIEDVLQSVPTYVMTFFRVLGLMLFAPLLGSATIPKRLKVLLAAVLAMAVVPTLALKAQFPTTAWEVALGIGGEMLFGIAMGLALSLVFIAAQWAGEIIGQQMGINLQAVFDPQYGAGSSLVGTLYFMLTLVIFMSPPVNGHHAMLRGLRQSFDIVPLLSAGVSKDIFSTIIDMLNSSTMLAIQLAAPVMVTMIVVDLAMGFVSKTMPQLNIMSAGLSVRAVLGMVLLILGTLMTSQVLQSALARSADQAMQVIGQ